MPRAGASPGRSGVTPPASTHSVGAPGFGRPVWGALEGESVRGPHRRQCRRLRLGGVRICPSPGEFRTKVTGGADGLGGRVPEVEDATVRPGRG